MVHCYLLSMTTALFDMSDTPMMMKMKPLGHTHIAEGGSHPTVCPMYNMYNTFPLTSPRDLHLRYITINICTTSSVYFPWIYLSLW